MFDATFWKDLIKQQGFSVVLLISAVFWFNSKNKSLEEKIDKCNSAVIEVYSTQTQRLSIILQEYTDQIEKSNNLYEKIITKLDN